MAEDTQRSEESLVPWGACGTVGKVWKDLTHRCRRPEVKKKTKSSSCESGTAREHSRFREESSPQTGQIKEGSLEEAETDFLVLVATDKSSWVFSDLAKHA